MEDGFFTFMYFLSFVAVFAAIILMCVKHKKDVQEEEERRRQQEEDTQRIIDNQEKLIKELQSKDK